jgi:hypothetical protein
MYSQGFGQHKSVAEICKILYAEATNRSTVQKWHEKFGKDDFETRDFPLNKHKILNGQLTEFSKTALVVYDHGNGLTAEKNRKRINKLFGKEAVTLEFVQVILTKRSI